MIGRVLVCAVLFSAVGAVGAQATEGALSIDAAYDANPAPDVLCHGLRVVGDGTARGAPIGQAHWHDEECADLIAQPGSVTVRDGHLTLTTANGDVLHVSYGATGAPPGTDGFIYLSGSFEIAGGTGRFLNAAGAGSITAVANAFFPATTAHLEGSFALH